MKNETANFGSWTSSLDSGSRLQLSAFWKQRIQRLPALASTARMSQRSLVATLVLAIAVVLSPLVELVPAAPERLATQEGFVATFSNGVSVELIGLADYDAKDQPWWQPDGTPLTWQPEATIGAALNQAPNRLGRKLCWRWQGIGDLNVQTSWMTSPRYRNYSGGKGNDEQGNPTLKAAAVGLVNQETCNVQFSMSVPSSKWRMVETGPANSLAGLSWSLPSGEKAGLTYFPARPAGKDSIATVSYKMPGEARFVMIDRQGKAHTGHMDRRTGVLGFTNAQIRFAGIQPNQFASWQLQTRQRKTETIEFRNVSLHLDKVTEVSIAGK